MIDLSKYDNRSFGRGASRAKEFLWLLCRSVFFATWLPVPSGIKVRCLRLFGAKVGRAVVIRSRVNITFPWRFECGDHVWIGDEVMLLSLGRVKLGSNVCLSQRAFLCTGSHDFRKESFDLVVGDIEVGDSCWIAANAFVGPNARVPNGTMVKAGAVWRNESSCV